MLISVLFLAIAANEAHYCDCCRNTGHFLGGVERVTHFVNIHVHCIDNNLKMMSKCRHGPPLEKILPAPMVHVVDTEEERKLEQRASSFCI